jgi:hypothetical protein
MKMEASYNKDLRTYECKNKSCRKENIHESLINNSHINNFKICKDVDSYVIYYELCLKKQIRIIGDFGNDKTYIFNGNEESYYKDDAIYVTDFLPFQKGALKQFNKYISLKEFL